MPARDRLEDVQEPAVLASNQVTRAKNSKDLGRAQRREGRHINPSVPGGCGTALLNPTQLAAPINGRNAHRLPAELISRANRFVRGLPSQDAISPVPPTRRESAALPDSRRRLSAWLPRKNSCWDCARVAHIFRGSLSGCARAGGWVGSKWKVACGGGARRRHYRFEI